MRTLWTKAAISRRFVPQVIAAGVALLFAEPVFAQGNSPWENAVNVLQQGDSRLMPTQASERMPTRPAEQRKTFRVRGEIYRLRASEIRTLSELGKFPAVAAKDLERFVYNGDKGRARADVQNLIRRGLVAQRKIPHPEVSPRRLLTLSKQGHRFLTITKSTPKTQAIYYGFTNPTRPTMTQTCIGCTTPRPRRLEPKADEIFV